MPRPGHPLDVPAGTFRTGSACDVSVAGLLAVAVAGGVRPVLLLHRRLTRALLAVVTPSTADDGGGLHLRVVVVAERCLVHAGQCGTSREEQRRPCARGDGVAGDMSWHQGGVRRGVRIERG